MKMSQEMDYSYCPPDISTSLMISSSLKKTQSTTPSPRTEVIRLSEAFSKINFNNNQKEDLSHKNEAGMVHKGRCKWFNVAKGWGFITPIGGGQEVFVHQSVIQMSGFRSLGEMEEVEYECKVTERGLEATRVTGRHGIDCHGSTFRLFRPLKKRVRKVRCYNCGEFANHIASKCELGPQPKRCHKCKKEDHLFADCPFKSIKSLPSGTNSSISEHSPRGPCS